MHKIAVFPGSFDPFTVGHEALVLRALPLFDKIIIAIGYNLNKQGFFPLAKRKQWIEAVFSGEAKVEVQTYEMLTVDFCTKNGANFILRGLRNVSDFEFEHSIAQMNRVMHPEIESVFLITAPELSAIASNIVRDIYRHGGDIRQFIPKAMNLEI